MTKGKSFLSIKNFLKQIEEKGTILVTPDKIYFKMAAAATNSNNNSSASADDVNIADPERNAGGKNFSWKNC